MTHCTVAIAQFGVHFLGTADASSMWHDMFSLSLPLAEKILRPVLVYFILIVGLRLSGKRELAQLNPFDLIVLLMLSNTVQNAIIGDDNSVTGGLVGAAALLGLNYFVIRVVRRSKRLQRLLEGRSDVLIWHGKVIDQNLEKELMTRADLTAAAHKQGIASLKDVERCVLEPTGTISFIEHAPSHEAQRHDQLVALLAELKEELAAIKSGQPPAAKPL